MLALKGVCTGPRTTS